MRGPPAATTVATGGWDATGRGGDVRVLAAAGELPVGVATGVGEAFCNPAFLPAAIVRATGTSDNDSGAGGTTSSAGSGLETLGVDFWLRGIG